MVYLRKERSPIGTYNKLKLKRGVPCNILRQFSSNAYELELLSEIGNSPIFNVVNLYPFKEIESVRVDEPINDVYQSNG